MLTLLFALAWADDLEMPKGLGHCSAEEGVWFHCPMASGKVASVCGPADASTLHYRFGKPGTVGLELGGKPADKGITFSYDTGMRNESWALTFRNDGHTYELLLGHMFGYQPDGSIDEGMARVLVKKGDKELARLECTSADVKGPFSLLEERVPAAKSVDAPAQ